MTESMARAVLSSINRFTDVISQEKSHLEKVKSEVESICREIWGMRRFLKDVDEEAGPLIEGLGFIIHDAESAIVNYVRRTARSRARNSLFRRYGCRKYSGAHENVIKEINSIAERLKVSFKEFSTRYSGVKSFHLGARLSQRLRSFDLDETEEDLSTNVVGIRQDMENLQAQLFVNRNHSRIISVRNHSRIISVVGVKGIGKTTLAWKIYKSKSVEEHFQFKAWVCVSAMDDDLNYIWEGICKQITEFRQDKRYLVVIDDVGDPQVWKALLEKIPESGPGSRIILTTRDVEVACSADYSHRLKVLSKAESWELFNRKLFVAPWRLGREHNTRDSESSIPLPLELDDLGKKMVAKCGGIPYLIINLAHLLSTVNANTLEWSCVLHGTDTHLSQEQHPWFNLSFSLHEILPLHVKQFLHLFPTSTEIPERRMILSWAVEGGLWKQQISNSGEGEAAAAASMRWVHDLQDLNLIQAAKVSSLGIAKTYRITPDLPLVHILKAGGAHGTTYDDSTVWRLADQYDGKDPHSRRIHSNINSPEELQPYRSLRSFWCFNYPAGYKAGQEVGSFLKRCININNQKYLWFLRVLDLEGVYKPSLPKAIGELINLHYLGLRWTYLDILPSSVENLINLQTLDTKHTDIRYYPTIRNMKRLQQLYLNERHPSELVTQLSYLTDLQILSGVIVDDLNLSQVKDGLYKLRNLRKLRLTCRLNPQQREAMARWIGQLENLRTLKLTSKDQGDQRGTDDEPATLRWLWLNLRNKQLSRMYLRGRLEMLDHQPQLDFGSNLTSLTLSLTQLHTDPMPILGELPELKLLRLFSKSFIGKHMDCFRGQFLQLRFLKIWKLEELEEWTVEDGAMPKLEELEIRSCKMLKKLPVAPEKLLVLKLPDMPKEFTDEFKPFDWKKNASLITALDFWFSGEE